MPTDTNEAIFAIREEFSHSSPRMAQAIHHLRDLCAEHATFALKNQQEMEANAAALANQAAQIKAQTTELINAGNRIQELKLEVAEHINIRKHLAEKAKADREELARQSLLIADDKQTRADLQLALTNADIAIAKFRDQLAEVTEKLASTSIALAVCNEARIAEANKHIEYVERTGWEIAQAERNLQRIESYRRTIRQLTDENIELHGKAEQKWVWRMPATISTSIRDKLTRRDEDKATGETA